MIKSDHLNLKFSPVCKIFCLLSCPYKLYYSKELLVAVELLLLLQHQHEVVPEAGLHHHPVHRTWTTHFIMVQKTYYLAHLVG